MRLLMLLLLLTIMVGLNVLQCQEVVDAQLTNAEAPPKPGDVLKSAGVRTPRLRGKACVCTGANKVQCCKPQRHLKKLKHLEKKHCRKNGIVNYEQCKKYISTPI